MIRRHSVKSMSSQAVKGTMAALLTRMSSVPKAAMVCSMSDVTCAGSDTSTVTAMAPGIWAAAAAAPGPSISATTTLAPFRGELVGDGSADALGAARDDRDAILELHGSPFLLLSDAVEVGCVLPAQPGRHLMRREDLRVVLLRPSP